jgi:hypothetical protein
MFDGGHFRVRQFFLSPFVDNKKRCVKAILLIFIVTFAMTTVSSGQKQLVILKKEQVLLRLYPGDEIVLKLKNSKTLKRSYVNNLFENAVVTHRDTIPFHKIDRIYFRQHSRMNKIGGLLVFGGGTLLIVDQLNNTVVHGNEFDVDRSFTTSVLGGMAVGLPMMLIKKNSEKIGYKSRLLVVSKGSIFYRPDSRGYVSPYMEN